MFTGIITDIGEIDEVRQLDHGKAFRIATAYDTGTIDIGASIAHDGVCLTVTAKDTGRYEVEAWEEALRLSTAGKWTLGRKLNLERALKVGDELGGHIVSGHIDGMARVTAVQDEGEARRFTLASPPDLAKFIAPKGSVALNGTSLTVNAVDGASFDVLLIRHSLAVTTWRDVARGDAVNIEVDTMARYAARLGEVGVGGEQRTVCIDTVIT